MAPVLKQFTELTLADFESSPLWAHCHSLDYDEPWYDDTDEEAFRRWDGPLPVDPASGMFLVRATLTLADGRAFTGFLTPANPADGGNLGIIQPHLFVGGRVFSFWGGLVGVPPRQRKAFYAAIGADPAHAFPIQFSASSDLAIGVTSGAIAGFYRIPKRGGTASVER